MSANTPFSSTRKRRQQDPSNRATLPDVAATLAVATLKLRCTFTVPMVKGGVPHYAISGGAHVGTEYPTAITYVSPTVFDLTYAHSVATGDTVIIPSKDGGLRGFQGQYVAAQTKTL